MNVRTKINEFRMSISTFTSEFPVLSFRGNKTPLRANRKKILILREENNEPGVIIYFGYQVPWIT